MFFAVFLSHLESNNDYLGSVLARWLVLLCLIGTPARTNSLSVSVYHAYGITMVVWRMDLSKLCTWFFRTLRYELKLFKSILLLLDTAICLG